MPSPVQTYSMRRASASEYEQALALRIHVFCDIQGFSREGEPDHYDKDAIHIVALTPDEAKVAAYLRIIENTETPACAKLGRIVVSPDHQGKGLGKKLLEYAEEYVRETLGAVKTLKLGSQFDKKAFYEKCGYEAKGDIYDDEGCPHIWMYKNIA
ncbi:hypothetical protein GGI07_005421 [Coemansia sp. Benny D115]|nr:hypothetical protein GGI07_005421 [Coemansia sp. Benny D115]